MRTLLLEPHGGLAGDMLLAALLDLDRPEFDLAELRRLAEALVPGEARLTSSEVLRGAFRGRHLQVETPESHHAPHRHLADLVERLGAAPLSERARARAEAVLRRLAEAEAEVHATSVEAVHFHEVGAVDTLIDVAGVVHALERLRVEAVWSRPAYVGGGTIRGAHGTMPVPAPGTAALLRGLPVELGTGGERVTPTGAALLAELVDAFVDAGPPRPFAAEALGYGAGTRDPAEGPANLLRVQLGRAGDGAGGGAPTRASAWLLELNLDDATPEEVGFLVQELRNAGALEAWTQPLQMKKDRPGVLVAALARADARDVLEAVAFRHSGTLGVRWSERQRTERPRARLVVDLGPALGLAEATVRVQQRLPIPGTCAEDVPSGLDLSPEHDDLAALARRTGRPLRALEELAVEAARALVGSTPDRP